MFSKKSLLLAAMIATLGFVQSCSQANSESTSVTHEDLYSQIKQVASIEGCTTHSDCALLPIGHKPCGGPEAYMPYSKTNSDVDRLESLGQAYSEQRRQYNQDNQIMGTCVVTPKPKVSCIRNQCMASEQSTHIQ
ncbi:hypothetical protein [Kangiella marina]|uniref:Secreted protein n=1 Tax=Kangiella marina TaxID=1079178 RepID=A0ABP8IFP4_9GAMM